MNGVSVYRVVLPFTLVGNRTRRVYDQRFCWTVWPSDLAERHGIDLLDGCVVAENGVTGYRVIVEPTGHREPLSRAMGAPSMELLNVYDVDTYADVDGVVRGRAGALRAERFWTRVSNVVDVIR